MANYYEYSDGSRGYTEQPGAKNLGEIMYDGSLRNGAGTTNTEGVFTATQAPEYSNASFGGGSGAVGASQSASQSSTGGGSSSSSSGSSGMPTFNLSSVATQGPTSWNVSKDQTVAGQLSSLLASDSPLMQQARTRAMQTAQSRGLLNSSMAASAGEAAMYDAAMPIATADAQTYGSAAQFNADAGNVFTRDSNAFARDAAMANFNLGANDWAARRAFEREQGAAGTAFDRDQRAADAALQREMELNRTTRQQAAELEAAGKAQEESYAKQRAYINAINNARTDYADKLAGVSDSTSMSEEVKNETVKNLQASYNTIIRNYAQLLGWDSDSWVIKSEPKADGDKSSSGSQSSWFNDPNATGGG